jgi:hypothetical protein
LTDNAEILERFTGKEIAEASPGKSLRNLIPAEIGEPLIRLDIMIKGKKKDITILYNRQKDEFYPVDLGALPKEFKHKGEFYFRFISADSHGAVCVAINTQKTLAEMEIMLMGLSAKTLDVYRTMLDTIKQMYVSREDEE